MTTTGDLLAIGDVLDVLTADIEALDAAQAIITIEALKQVRNRLDLALSLLKTRALNALDGQPVKVGTTLYVAKATGKWRPEWSAVRKHVANAALVDENGEVQTADQAAARAIDIMRDLYVSPSTMPKQGALDRLNLRYEDVADFERGVPELKAMPLGEEPER